MKTFIFLWLLIKFINYYISKGAVSIFMAQLWVCIRFNGDFIKMILIPTIWKTFPMYTKNISIEKIFVFVVSTRAVAWFLFMISKNKILLKYYLQLYVWDYNIFWSTMVLSSITQNGLNCTIVIWSPLLDKNKKHTTLFMFSKINSMNVKNNINDKIKM